ncbi:hypothetical protein, partial [Cupriavidus necator]|uniref:hypothetical protein n=1 Tax=Cupriavidus necator TaxID=106590 RepID=UPI001C40B8A9
LLAKFKCPSLAGVSLTASSAREPVMPAGAITMTMRQIDRRKVSARNLRILRKLSKVQVPIPM